MRNLALTGLLCLLMSTATGCADKASPQAHATLLFFNDAHSSKGMHNSRLQRLQLQGR